MKSTLSKALNKLMLNQLAQVCNNLYYIIQRVKHFRLTNPPNFDLDNTYRELMTNYETLFKLIYGNE